MAFNIQPPGHNGQGVNLNFGDANGDGRFDWGLGIRNAQHYGNGYAGAYNSNEVGFNTDRGVYLDSRNGSYNPMAQQHNYHGVDSSGVSRGSSTYMDMFGNYDNNRYANDVWGNYYGGQTQSNNLGWSNTDVGGNVWTGNHGVSHQQANVFSGYDSYAYQTYTCGGGHAAGGWFF